MKIFAPGPILFGGSVVIILSSRTHAQFGCHMSNAMVLHSWGTKVLPLPSTYIQAGVLKV